MNEDERDLPEEVRAAWKKVLRLEWLTLAYLFSAIVLMGLVMGQSQAMKTAWIDDVLSLVPPIAILISSRFSERPPNRRFPYGYHRASDIASLAGALALLVMGVYLLIDAAMKLIEGEHPSIGGITIFGHHVWSGWLMIAALVWSGLPATLLGRAKIPLSKTLDDKALHADADMNKADWLAAAAAVAGIVGIALGAWWADGAAAAVISIDILYDGGKNVLRAVHDLMNRHPKTVDDEDDPIENRIREELRKLTWVRDVSVRMHEEGHRLIGDVFVVPEGPVEDLIGELERARERLKSLDWRIIDLVIAPVRALSDDGGK